MNRSYVAIRTVSAAALSTGCAIVVNLATDWKTNPWAWVGVIAITALVAIVSCAQENIGNGREATDVDETVTKQKQRSGRESTNLQSGRDIVIRAANNETKTDDA
jgi:hypothetical protein